MAPAMVGAIIGVEEELEEAADVYGQMYAEAYWRAFDHLTGQVGSGVAALLGGDFQLLFYVFSKRQIGRRVCAIEVDDLSEDPDAGRSRPGCLGTNVCA